MEELIHKRNELKELMSVIQTKKQEMEQLVVSIQSNIQIGMESELKELEELKTISLELTESNLQSTIDRLLELKQTVQGSIQPLVALAASNNEFAASVLQSLQDSGSAIQQVQGLFGELESEVEQAKQILRMVGVSM
jgi:translation initiation factor 2 beta subunit (eIF-2beta)/eIF-5